MDNHFVVGQQVYCIRDDWEIYEDEISPKKGNIYTIRSMEMINDYEYGECLGLRFKEIVNPVLTYTDGIGEAIFHALCFRPIKETSIDVFKAILKKIPTQELV